MLSNLPAHPSPAAHDYGGKTGDNRTGVVLFGISYAKLKMMAMRRQTMTTSLWKTLPQPIIGLAPMDGVTDSAFRYIVATYGKPDIVFTEFTNVHDICSGRLKTLDSLRYSEVERPSHRSNLWKRSCLILPGSTCGL